MKESRNLLARHYLYMGMVRIAEGELFQATRLILPQRGLSEIAREFIRTASRRRRLPRPHSNTSRELCPIDTPAPRRESPLIVAP